MTTEGKIQELKKELAYYKNRCVDYRIINNKLAKRHDGLLTSYLKLLGKKRARTEEKELIL